MSVRAGVGPTPAGQHHLGATRRNDGLGWLRQEENQYLACPPEVARELPVELAKLIGYSRAAYALGYYGDTQDPLELLHPGTTSARGFSPS